jgi:predicted nucleic acid-binding Zn ribbon protein
VSTPAASGPDLARTALRAARAAARRNSTATRQPRRVGRTTAGHGAGREPAALEGVLQRMMAERGWEQPAAGATVIDRWPDIVGPDHAPHWTAETYEPDSRTLTVRADSPTWATALRLAQPQVLALVDAAVPGAVRAIAVRLGRTPGGQIPEPRQTPDQPAAEPGDEAIRRRPDAYQRRLPAEYRQHRAASHPAPQAAPQPANPFLPPEFGRIPREDEHAFAEAAYARQQDTEHVAARDDVQRRALAVARAAKAARRADAS